MSHKSQHDSSQMEDGYHSIFVLLATKRVPPTTDIVQYLFWRHCFSMFLTSWGIRFKCLINHDGIHQHPSPQRTTEYPIAAITVIAFNVYINSYVHTSRTVLTSCVRTWSASGDMWLSCDTSTSVNSVCSTTSGVGSSTKTVTRAIDKMWQNTMKII